MPDGFPLVSARSIGQCKLAVSGAGLHWLASAAHSTDRQTDVNPKVFWIGYLY